MKKQIIHIYAANNINFLSFFCELYVNFILSDLLLITKQHL